MEGSNVALASVPWAEPARWTAEDLLSLPDDGRRYELVHGRLVRMAPTTWGHGQATENLQFALGSYVRAHHLGKIAPAETGFDLTLPGDDEDTVLGPDIAFVRMERVPASDAEVFARLAPDLVVETASKGQHRPEMHAKARLWLKFGVRIVWLIWPRRRSVEIWLPGNDAPHAELRDDQLLDGDDVVPGFTIPVAEIFR
jgi:Uma2 family endonuclease